MLNPREIDPESPNPHAKKERNVGGRPSNKERAAKKALAEAEKRLKGGAEKFSGDTQIKIPAAGWSLRDYQHPLWDYLEGGGSRAIVNWHRRAGKDLFAINRIAWCMLNRPGLYWHVFPTYNQGRKVIWEGYRNDGVPFLHAFPRQLVESENNTEMRISLSLGSTYQVVGADDPDRLVGSNPIGIVFSEFALMPQAERVWQLLSPILFANGGWALFISTPRGRNFFWKLYDSAGSNPEWFRETLTILDSKYTDAEGNERPVVTMADIDELRGQGTDEAFIQQEFFGSFTAPLSGSYYGNILDTLDKTGKIGKVPWEPQLPVNTWWDLGVRDSTSIVCTQELASEIRVIDCYQNSGEPMSTYVKWLHEKPYVYGKHIAPWDITVRELSVGKARIEVARSLGIRFTVCPQHRVQDGIEAVRNTLQTCFFDREKCAPLLEALRNYRKKYNPEMHTFGAEPVHDKYSHFADAFRTGCFLTRPARPLVRHEKPMTSQPVYDFGLV